ncbi:MAG: phosphoadenosine phosphosulfate reductase family protein [Oscillospiraceae bacterium]|nr:phosphoadenosine phosphosulfate reductase family protein [Oscillospiraceae bacterium]
MNIFTKADLTTMQKYPLSVKIGRTQARIMEYYNALGGKIYVSCSGGVDSIVLLDIVRRIYPNVLAVFCDTGLEYPEIRQLMKTLPNVEWLRPDMTFAEVVKTKGYPVVGKELSRTLYYARRGSFWALQKMDGKFKNGEKAERYQRFVKYKYLLDAPFAISEACCDEMKIKPFRHFGKLSGLYPITGVMAEESLLRQSVFLRNGCNSFTGKQIMSTPLSFWTTQDTLRYLKLTGIPYASVYGDIVEEGGKLKTTGCQRTGCFACMYGMNREKEPNRYQRMKLTHPKLYSYCVHTLKCGAVLDYMGVKY